MTITKKTVYVIDDDTLYLYGIKRLLSKNLPEIDLTTFGNGQEAITALHRVHKEGETMPDVILLDLNMPKMNGWEFLRNFEQLKSETNQEVQVFVITSQPDSETMRLNQVEWDDSVKEFIQKPVNAETILKLLQ
jgi:CheY-like chemotaxis protein